MTKDDLIQIDHLLQKRFENNNKKLRQELKNDFKTETGSLLQEFKHDLKIEIDPIHERLAAQHEQIFSVEKKLSAQISLEATDLAELIRDVIFPKLEQHDEQILELEKKAGIKPHRH